MASKLIVLPDGNYRRMDYRSPAIIQVVNPNMQRQVGSRFRDITLADIITVPVKRQGTFTLMDMLTHESVINVLKVYNGLKKD